MRVLIACEFSGIVREAFRARGHDAWSCDLLRGSVSEPETTTRPQFAPAESITIALNFTSTISRAE